MFRLEWPTSEDTSLLKKKEAGILGRNTAGLSNANKTLLGGVDADGTCWPCLEELSHFRHQARGDRQVELCLCVCDVNEIEFVPLRDRRGCFFLHPNVQKGTRVQMSQKGSLNSSHSG